MKNRTSPRIFGIMASDAPEAVIFRRGPSKQVLLIKWHLDSDTLEYGQWFKGRIYEQRCDLSPSGDLLIYFAAKYKEPLFTWTAISRPPYWKALALWRKGDGWGGGGVFESELVVELNHRPAEAVLARGYILKENMRVSLYGDSPGWGEDFPIYHTLLSRRGWKLVDEGQSKKQDDSAQVGWLFIRPMIYQKPSQNGHRLQMQFKGIHQRNDAWYWLDYEVLDESGKTLFQLPRTDWADWHGGDLLFAKDGKLFRLNKKNFKRYIAKGEEALKLIADLTELKFEDKTAPHQATTW